MILSGEESRRYTIAYIALLFCLFLATVFFGGDLKLPIFSCGMALLAACFCFGGSIFKFFKSI